MSGATFGVDVGSVTASLRKRELHRPLSRQEHAAGEVMALAHDPMTVPISCDVEVIRRTYRMRGEGRHDGAKSCFTGTWIRKPCPI